MSTAKQQCSIARNDLYRAYTQIIILQEQIQGHRLWRTHQTRAGRLIYYNIQIHEPTF